MRQRCDSFRVYDPRDPVHVVTKAITDAVDLRAAGAAYGTFSFDVSGELSISDPDSLDSASLLGQMVTLQVAQLTAS